MTRQLHVLNPMSSIAEAAKLFSAHRIHHIPIVSDGELVGIVSKSDFLFFKRGFQHDRHDSKIEEIRMNNYLVSQIMTTGLAKLEPTDKINVALEVFKENLFHAIPVVENNQLVGLVTTYDILNQLAKDNSAVAQY